MTKAKFFDPMIHFRPGQRLAIWLSDDDDVVDKVLTTATMLRRRPSTTHSKLIRKKLRTRSGTKLDGEIGFCLWARNPKQLRLLVTN